MTNGAKGILISITIAAVFWSLFALVFGAKAMVYTMLGAGAAIIVVAVVASFFHPDLSDE